MERSLHPRAHHDEPRRRSDVAPSAAARSPSDESSARAERGLNALLNALDRESLLLQLRDDAVVAEEVGRADREEVRLVR